MEISRTSPLTTLFDSRKGNMGNRVECATEKYKERLKATAPLFVASAATGVAIGVKPDLAVKTAKAVGTGISKLIGKLPETLKNSKVLTTVAKNPITAGAVAIGMGVLGIITHISNKLSYTEGRIDQKYEDKAKLQGLTA